MSMNRFLAGIGIALAMLLAFAATAAAENVVYFDPDPSCAVPGEEITVTLWLDATDGTAAFNDAIHFDPSVVNITSGTPGDFPLMWGFVHYGDYVKIGGWTSDGLDRTGHLKLADLTLVANNSGTSILYHKENAIGNQYGVPLEATWNNGTFNCPCPTPETFTKDLVEGWNLVSLPLTADDMTVGSVLGSLSGNYDALYRYDAVNKSWVAMDSSDTMENGIGYFIHMTSADTWTYTGMPYEQMNVSLEQGLNMIGWINCSKPIDDALSSIEGEYWYVARWNATAQSFEVYNPLAPPGFNDFTTMDRGEGYFISARETCTLEYP